MTLHVVTGASRGLGAAMVQHLLREGHQVVAAACGPAPVSAGAGCLSWTSLDLGNPEAAREWIERALNALPRQEAAVLILNAGVVEPIAPVASLAPAAIEAHVRVNLVSPMVIAAGFLKATAGWTAERRILAISSGAARRGLPYWSAYCSSKAGLDGFVRGLNAEYAEQGGKTRAVSLAPGVIDTVMQKTVRSTDAPQQARFISLHAEARLTRPADAAASILAYLRREDFGTVEIDDIRRSG